MKNNMTVFGKEYVENYDYIYQDKDYKKECDFIEKIFTKQSKKVKKVLDLGCGTGGHALILAKRGYRIIGIDRAEYMLKIAQRKAKNTNCCIDFIKGDITNIDLNEKFDAVISMFAVMGYQTTNSAIENVCKIAKKHLSTGGIFLFDCWYGPAVLVEKPCIRVKEISLNKDEKIIRFTEPILNILDHTVETRFKVLKIKNSCLVSETNESHFMRFLFPQEIKYFLEVAGFKKIEFCPFLELEKPLTEHDWNMAVIARR
ncbi:class I SAM-dependent methyltransferase [Patescibacteria group bacterium]|nr:class I SAM-dependent methyltransferase [Patescibacteria group bacterium]